MIRKPPTAGILVAVLAVMLILLFRNFPSEQSSPSIQTGNVSPPRSQNSEKEDGLIVVENVDLSADELQELDELFEPIEDKRRMTEVVQLGQSVLADLLTYDDGRVAYTFLTPQSMIAESGEVVLIYNSETSILHTDGSSEMITAPTVIAKENQSAQISISRAEGATYSMQFSGILIGDDTLALSAEMTGDPAMHQTSR